METQNFTTYRFINVSMSLPKTSYVKMVDVWLLFTLLIPFLEVGQKSKGDNERVFNVY